VTGCGRNSLLSATVSALSSEWPTTFSVAKSEPRTVLPAVQCGRYGALLFRMVGDDGCFTVGVA
jgi:hypothetical protein